MSTLDELLKDIYGKDVVNNAYASPAGKLTKAQAHTKLLSWVNEVIGPNEEPDTNGNVGVMAIYQGRNQLRKDQREKLNG